MSEASCEFLDNLELLFEEIADKHSEKRYGSFYTRRQITDLLVACSTTTPAEAVATHPVTLIDGNLPTIPLGLPPPELQLTEMQKVKLDKNKNGAGLVSALRKIYATLLPSGAEASGKRKRPSESGSHTSSPESTKKLKMEEGSESNSQYLESGFEPVDKEVHESTAPVVNENTVIVPIIRGQYPVDEYTAEQPIVDGDPVKGELALGEPMVRGLRKPVSSWRMQEAKNKDCDEADSSDSDSDDEAPHAIPRQHDTITTLIDEASAVPAWQWDTYKPELIQHLHVLGVILTGATTPPSAVPTASTGTSTDDADVDDGPHKRRLGMAFHLLETGRTTSLDLPPAAAWQSYKDKLMVQCQAGRGLPSEPSVQQRIRKVGSVIYLPEEEAAMATRDFGRMKKAVDLCCRLVALTGTAEQMRCPDVAARVKAWGEVRTRDIWFIQRMVVASDSMDEMLGGMGSAADSEGV